MQYFDKTFFKFLLGFVVMLAISFAIIIGTNAYYLEQQAAQKNLSGPDLQSSSEFTIDDTYPR
jgi:hypothetical protein